MEPIHKRYEKMKCCEYGLRVLEEQHQLDDSKNWIELGKKTSLKTLTDRSKNGARPIKAGACLFKVGEHPFKAGVGPFKAGVGPFKAGVCPFKAGCCKKAST
jgi:hypothetical protein